MSSLTIQLHIINLAEWQAELNEIAAVATRAASLSEPRIAELLNELLDLLGKGSVTLLGERETEPALGTLELGVRLKFSPRVLEIVAAIRAMELQGE